MSSYTVTERDGCRLVEGLVPLRAFAGLTKGMPKKAVMDSHAARVLGVTFAMGLPSDLEALCAQPDVVEAAYQRARRLGPGLSEDAVKWLALGRQGSSSQTMFERFTGVRLTDKPAHPRDPSQLGRCRRLLEEVPELKDRLGEMASVSEVWGRLVAAWPELCAEMDAEAPNWRQGLGSFPRTDERMKALGC